MVWISPFNISKAADSKQNKQEVSRTVILYLILVFSGLEVQSSQGKVYGSIGGTSNIKDDYDIKIAESIRNKKLRHFV